MGSLRNYPRDRYIMEPAEALLPSALLSSMPAFMSVGLGHAPLTPPTKPTPPLVAPENTKCDPLGNVSMDSGIAGLRDQGSASPPNWHPANHAHSPRSPAIVQPRMANINNNVHASHKTTSSRDKELPEFIVDRITRTTYRKGKFLGKGGFARVHELTDLTTGRMYAGKIIPKARITKPHHRDKIVREIELHRPLVHPHVVRFYHCFEDDDNVYIILENCPSKSLVHVMKHRGMLTEPEVRYYIRQLGEGLRYVHQSGVVHRDLKLGNMFLSQDLQVKIGDFGLAARRDPQAKVTICGTPNYIAPEVLNKKGHGYEADLWAMGCIMYAMLVGQPPFETSSLEETYQRILHNQYHLPSHISPAAAHVIRRLLAPRRSQRMTLEQLLHSEFLTQGFLPTTLPSSSTLVSPTFPQPQRETNLRSGHSHAHLERGVEAGGGRDRSESSKTCVNRSRPESLKLMSPSSKEKLGRSQSLRESSQKKEREREREREKEQEKEKVQLPVTLRQRLSSVILGVGRDRSRERNVMTAPPVSLSARALYHALDDCLCVAPHALCNPSLAHCSPLFISKWIDYSNKYGFGFQLSDHTVGVLFNDACRITLDSDRNRVDFEDRDGSTSNFNYNSPPVTLKSRSTLLRYFTQYMDENLTEGGDSQSGGKEGRKKSVHMKRWVRTPKAIIMQMDNGTLQINFFKDHTKVVLWWNRDGYNVTYINSDRLGSTYRLVDIMTQGCEPSLRERLLYALTVLREFAELDQVSSPTSPHV